MKLNVKNCLNTIFCVSCFISAVPLVTVQAEETDEPEMIEDHYETENEELEAAAVPQKPITAIYLDYADLYEVPVGWEYNMTVFFEPEDTDDDTTVIWSTSNPDVATIDDGKLVVTGVGTAYITAKVGKFEETVTVKGIIPIFGISLDKNALQVKKGDTFTLTATARPLEPTDDPSKVEIFWSSSPEGMFEDLGNGKYKALKKGVGTITISTDTHDPDTDSCTVTVVDEITYGWEKSDAGWKYRRPDAQYSKGWEKINGKWYYFNDQNLMATGWKKVSDEWYYFESSGAMKTGWLKSGGKWYYLKQSGAMAILWQRVNGSWYFFMLSGEMYSGWLKYNGTWYYTKPSGEMATGWQKIGNTWYLFNNSGAMATGWRRISGSWYFFKGSGAMATGWQKISGSWYYFDGNGVMAIGPKTIGGKTYYFSSSGACQNP